MSTQTPTFPALQADKIIDLDIDNQPILFDGEKPKQLIGFSVQIRKNFIGEDIKVFFAERVKLNEGYTDIRREVKKLVKSLQTPKAISEKTSNEITQKQSGAQVPIITRDPSTGKETAYERPALLEINCPTLFIFTTNVTNSKFVTPFLKEKEPSKKLDPYCSNLRGWKNRNIMGMYSRYDFATGDKPGEYWYYVNVQTPKSDEGDEQHMMMKSGDGNGEGGGTGGPGGDADGWQDPGNGSGEGEEFP